MRRPLVPLLALAAALLYPVATGAQTSDPRRQLSLSYSQLSLSIANRANDLNMDASNRLWIPTDQGVAAITGNQPADFFPFRASDGLLANNVTAVTFGTVDGEEKFFLGFLIGIQYGRVLSTSGLQIEGTLLRNDAALDAVAELASDGTANVWAATAGGLVAWDLAGSNPTFGRVFQPSVSSDQGPVTNVAVAPWGEAAWSVDDRLYLTTRDSNTGQPLFDRPRTGARINDLTFDAEGNLWVSTDSTLSPNLFRYNRVGDGLSSADRNAFTFSATDATGRTPADLSVNLLTGTVWAASVDSGGSAQGAYFQQLDANGNLTGSWSRETSLLGGDRVFQVFTDRSGNDWFGTDQGVKAFIGFSITWGSSNYIGYGTSAQVRVFDYTFAGNGTVDVIPPEDFEIEGTGYELVESADDSGDFVGTFTFVASSDDPAGNNQIVVASSGGGVSVEAIYRFAPDPADPAAKVPISALTTWSNKKKFEDDLWIGGPCFLRALAP